MAMKGSCFILLGWLSFHVTRALSFDFRLVFWTLSDIAFRYMFSTIAITLECRAFNLTLGVK